MMNGITYKPTASNTTAIYIKFNEMYFIVEGAIKTSNKPINITPTLTTHILTFVELTEVFIASPKLSETNQLDLCICSKILIWEFLLR